MLITPNAQLIGHMSIGSVLYSLFSYSWWCVLGCVYIFVDSTPEKCSVLSSNFENLPISYSYPIFVLLLYRIYGGRRRRESSPSPPPRMLWVGFYPTAVSWTTVEAWGREARGRKSGLSFSTSSFKGLYIFFFTWFSTVLSVFNFQVSFSTTTYFFILPRLVIEAGYSEHLPRLYISMHARLHLDILSDFDRSDLRWGGSYSEQIQNLRLLFFMGPLGCWRVICGMYHQSSCMRPIAASAK